MREIRVRTGVAQDRDGKWYVVQEWYEHGERKLDRLDPPYDTEPEAGAACEQLANATREAASKIGEVFDGPSAHGGNPPFGIKVIETAGLIEFGAPPPAGVWVKSYDPDAFGGRGDATWTEDPHEALAFDNARDATLCWAQQSTVKPFRADGKPNRPLTGTSVEILTLGIA